MENNDINVLKCCSLLKCDMYKVVHINLTRSNEFLLLCNNNYILIYTIFTIFEENILLFTLTDLTARDFMHKSVKENTHLYIK